VIPLYFACLPRTLEIFSVGSSRSPFVAAAPRVQIICGQIILSCFSRISFLHVSISQGMGVLFLGGRHLTMFVIYNSLRSTPIASRA